MVRVLRSALLKEMMDEPKYDERESMMFMDVVLNASESRRCSDGRMRRGRRRDAATERGRREAHIVGARVESSLFWSVGVQRMGGLASTSFLVICPST